MWYLSCLDSILGKTEELEQSNDSTIKALAWRPEFDPWDSFGASSLTFTRTLGHMCVHTWMYMYAHTQMWKNVLKEKWSRGSICRFSNQIRFGLWQALLGELIGNMFKDNYRKWELIWTKYNSTHEWKCYLKLILYAYKMSLYKKGVTVIEGAPGPRTFYYFIFESGSFVPRLAQNSWGIPWTPEPPTSLSQVC